MTVPPNRLLLLLINENNLLPLEVSGGGKHDPNEPQISPARAMQLAAAGLIEGVVKGRNLRAVRWLHESARPDPALCKPPTDDGLVHDSKAAGINARMHLGVYREHLPEAIVTEDHRGRRVTGQGEMATSCWSFYGVE
jgi:hypothetical protein